MCMKTLKGAYPFISNSCRHDLIVDPLSFRVYLRYKENETWHMRDFAEYFPIHFHSEGTIGVPIPKQPVPTATELNISRPSVPGDREIRSLNLSFKRKEHYWRYLINQE